MTTWAEGSVASSVWTEDPALDAGAYCSNDYCEPDYCLVESEWTAAAAAATTWTPTAAA